MTKLSRKDVSDFAAASASEWLETNGLGGYALSTVAGLNTRRYSGLLIAATKPPVGRAVLLSKFEETVRIGDRKFDLSVNQYPGTISPRGFRHLSGFRLDPFPVWEYDLDGALLEKRIFMPHGENATVCRWRLLSDGGDAALELRPLVAFRDHHHLNEAPPAGRFTVNYGEQNVSVETGELVLHLSHSASSVDDVAAWYYDVEYLREMERGFPFRENLYSPCSLRFDLSRDAVVIASTEPVPHSRADKLEKTEIKRRAKIVAAAKTTSELERRLVLAADQFIVKRDEGLSIIAGYPWFSDWGRDTMISLAGLTLSTNRPNVAKGILSEYARHVSEGMIPNRFPDAGESPDYNTADATLWFFEAVRALTERTSDWDFAREIYPLLADIIDHHVAGTRFNIRVDTDGLLFAGDESHNLTWMDAKIGDWVVTPRKGKAVEIQALWYNALLIAADFAEMFNGNAKAAQFRSMAEMAKSSFNGQFWNAGEQCLFDTVTGESKDASVRPNQIFAVSLFHSMLDREKARKVVEKVAAELLTPVGLRTLSPRDSRYCPRYTGSPRERDAAYHQGTVWAWLLGPYIEAFRKVHAKDKKARAYVADLLSEFRENCDARLGALGQIAEIFDAEPPHYPRGACAQAWSVAEILRALKSA